MLAPLIDRSLDISHDESHMLAKPHAREATIAGGLEDGLAWNVEQLGHEFGVAESSALKAEGRTGCLGVRASMKRPDLSAAGSSSVM